MSSQPKPILDVEGIQRLLQAASVAAVICARIQRAPAHLFVQLVFGQQVIEHGQCFGISIVQAECQPLVITELLARSGVTCQKSAPV